MTHSNIAAAVAVIAALICAPPIATAASPPAPQHVAHAQPWLDWANSFLIPGTGHRSDTTKNEISIETSESRAVFSGDAYDNEMGLQSSWSLLPDVDDEVL